VSILIAMYHSIVKFLLNLYTKFVSFCLKSKSQIHVIPKQPVEFYVHFLLTYDVSHTMHCFFR